MDTRLTLPAVALLAAAVLTIAPTSSQAAIFQSGPAEGGSWSVNLIQGTTELWLGNLVGPYDYVRADWVSGATFEAPFFRNMSNGWSAQAFGQTDTFGSATGPSSGFSFDVFFNDPIQNTTFRYFVYDGNTLKQAQEITVGSVGFISASDLSADTAPGRFDPVPEPGSILLVGLGLMGAVRTMRKRRLG